MSRVHAAAENNGEKDIGVPHSIVAAPDTTQRQDTSLEREGTFPFPHFSESMVAPNSNSTVDGAISGPISYAASSQSVGKRKETVLTVQTGALIPHSSATPARDGRKKKIPREQAVAVSYGVATNPNRRKSTRNEDSFITWNRGNIAPSSLDDTTDATTSQAAPPTKHMIGEKPHPSALAETPMLPPPGHKLQIMDEIKRGKPHPSAPLGTDPVDAEIPGQCDSNPHNWTSTINLRSNRPIGADVSGTGLSVAGAVKNDEPPHLCFSSKAGPSNQETRSAATKPFQKLAFFTSRKAALANIPSICVASSTPSHQPSSSPTKPGLGKGHSMATCSRVANSVQQVATSTSINAGLHNKERTLGGVGSFESQPNATPTKRTKTTKAGLRNGLKVQTPPLEWATGAESSLSTPSYASLSYQQYWEDSEDNDDGSTPAFPHSVGMSMPMPIPMPVPMSHLSGNNGIPGAHAVNGIGRSSLLDTAHLSLEDLDLEEQEEVLRIPIPSDLSEANESTTPPNHNSEIPISNTALPVARAIQDGSDTCLIRAEEVDQGELESKRASEKNRKMKFVGTAFFIIVLLLAATFVLMFKVFVFSKDINQISTRSPSLPTTEAPSFAPSSALDLLLKDLPNSTLESLRKYSTPQWNAREWLLDHPELPLMPEWRKKQLFALATFYYAMEGPTWPQVIKDRWLQYTDECLWFSNAYGQFEDERWKVLQSRIADSPCTADNRFQYLDLGSLELSIFHPNVPPEIALLSSLSDLSLYANYINTTIVNFLPSEMCQMDHLSVLYLSTNGFVGIIATELGCMTSLLELHLETNALTGHIPSALSWMTSMTSLWLNSNSLTGSIPTQLGVMTNLLILDLDTNQLTGLVPSEIGLMTNLEFALLFDNDLTGHIPSQLGMMSNISAIGLHQNQLTGQIPSQMGLMSNITQLLLSNNLLTGRIPTEMGVMQNLHFLYLQNNTLTGNIPTELGWLAKQGSLFGAIVAHNSLSGIVPEGLCSLGPYSDLWGVGLFFDCNDQLCGCCWCPCPGSDNSTDCPTEPVIPTEIVRGWPGVFPSPINSTNVVTINVYTDDIPEETKALEWSIRNESGIWEVLEFHRPQNVSSLHSYTMKVKSKAIYRLQVLDSWGDGTCCVDGIGWFTITNSTPSNPYEDGAVIWGGPGFFESVMEVLIWINPDGHAQHVEYVPGQGYALLVKETAEKELTIVVPELFNITNSSDVIEE